MKIAISGSAGTGKTTLAAALAECCSWQLIEEGYDEFFDPDARFIKSRPQLRSGILSLLESKNSLEDDASAFVADRCAADLFNLWMSQGFGDDQELTGRLYQRCRRYLEKYDCVFVLPWNALPLRQIDAPTNRRRAMNPWIQLYNHANVIGLLHQWLPPARLVPVPYHLVELRGRMEFVRELLRHRRQDFPCGS